MSRVLWQALRLGSTAMSAGFLLSAPVLAQEVSAVGNPSQPNPASSRESNNVLQELNQYSQVNLDTGPLERINSVSNLQDVSPTDWAFQALQSLADRYECLLAYPDGTYRGNRAMTRYEFAAGLNACLERIQVLIDENLANLNPEDLARLRRLQEEFSAELATLRGRVDALEVRTAELEANQFSTTTKLDGEALFALVDAFGDRGVTTAGGEDTETSFGYRVRLTLDTSFSGKDRLRTRLQAVDTARLDGTTGTVMSRLGFDGEGGGVLELNRLEYRFPVGNNARFWLAGAGIDQDHIISPINPLFESSGGGALSRFGRRNPTIFRQPAGSGFGVEVKAGNLLTIYGAYLADNAGTPTSRNGLFDGAYSATGQVVVSPVSGLDLGVAYSHSYFPSGEVNVSGSTGSNNARRPFSNDVATSSNNLGVQASWALSPVTISGWAGWSFAEARVSDGAVSEGDTATIFNWLVNVGVPDIGKEGSLLGVLVGQPPKVLDNDVDGAEDESTSLHIEALYRYPVTDWIDITPGFFVITNPDHNDDNDTIWVGTIRTRFKF
ncbi:carbohydrate porin [Oxynema sp. CENA135]|nr:carbohydrate porin [Oxynema sp. CENA135]